MQQSKTNLFLSRLFLPCTLLLGTSTTVLSAPDAFDFPEANQLGHAAPAPAAASNEALNYRKKSITVADLTHAFKNRIEVKFVDNSGIRLRKGRLTVLNASAKNTTVESDIKQLEGILQANGEYAIARIHELPEDKLDAMKMRGEKNSGQALSDLNLWFYIFVDAASDQELALIINQINQLSVVENASPSTLPAPSPGLESASAAESERYWQQHTKAPWPSAKNTPLINSHTSPSLMPDTQVSPVRSASSPSAQPPVADNYVAEQDYREKAPIGIDINYVNRRYFNADGRNWGYTDVEYSWNDAHQDLSQIADNVYVNGFYPVPMR